MEEQDNFIVLQDEYGDDVRFEFLDIVEYQGEEFAMLLPCDDDEDPGQVVVLKIESIDEDTDEETYVGVEDQELLDTVFEIFKEKYKDEFNFVD